ncbi:hypothetical protein PsorP6_012785 [Peronosclerospora sorghi]|uniref:Uncharacterized protein n=1 Tax=Peronosclerospora sorghi TaxID=230839 RepID=A0ACC0WH87_9STRA|nr:hypothetical protein PsorP6_012785 [Peronosclerospora sorghi]
MGRDGVCVTAAILMEVVVFLEATVDPEWLNPCWKASPLPSANNAITTATIASVTMRLYSLDEAISYGRVKRASKRKHRTISRISARQAQKIVIRCDKSTSAANGTTRSELPLFISTLSPGVVALATKMIRKILEAQRERSWMTLMYRKARREVAAIALLTKKQVEQWIQASLGPDSCRRGAVPEWTSRTAQKKTSKFALQQNSWWRACLFQSETTRANLCDRFEVCRFSTRPRGCGAPFLSNEDIGALFSAWERTGSDAPLTFRVYTRSHLGGSFAAPVRGLL